MRNNWLNQKENTRIFPSFNETEGVLATLSTLHKLHYIEKSNLLKYGYGLTLKALYPSSIERQNVKLALQIFNLNIVEALRTFGRKHSLENWESVANYIDIICKWWDIVNVKTLLKGQRLRNRYQEPVTKNSFHIFTFMEQFVKWLDDWERSNTTGRMSKETHSALRHTTLGLMEMSKYWLEKKGKHFFLLGKVQTDCLEDCFGKYRQLSGGNYHISIRQIYETENKLRIQNILPVVLKSKEAGEIIITADDNFDDITANNVICNNTIISSFLSITANEDNIDEIDEDTWPLLNYIAGYSVYSTIRKFRCSSNNFFITNVYAAHKITSSLG